MRFVEIRVWALASRILLALAGLEKTLTVFDLIPSRRRRLRPILPPVDGEVRIAGACLGRSVARSQYLRVRRQSHALVIGIQDSATVFGAHAWLEPYDPAPEGFVELRRLHR